MRFGLIIIFSPWHLFLTKGLHFFKNNCHEDTIIPEIKNAILADIQYVNKYNTFLMKLSLTIIFLYNMCRKREGFHFLNILKNDVYFVLLFQSYKRHTAYMQPYLFPRKSILLLHIFLYYCRMFQSIDSQPCQCTI